jgi:hypothetical protein
MTLTVRLESATENALASFCNSHALSKSQVVHRALESWLKAQPASNGHALLAFLPQATSTGKRVSAKSAASGAPYEPYSKASLRSKVLAKSSGKKA